MLTNLTLFSFEEHVQNKKKPMRGHVLPNLLLLHQSTGKNVAFKEVEKSSGKESEAEWLGCFGINCELKEDLADVIKVVIITHHHGHADYHQLCLICFTKKFYREINTAKLLFLKAMILLNCESNASLLWYCKCIARGVFVTPKSYWYILSSLIIVLLM